MDGPPPLAQQQNTDGDADHQPRRKADAVSSATDRARRRALRRLHRVAAHTATCPRRRSDATTLPAGVATESDDRADRLTAGSAGAGAFSVPTIDLRRLRGTDAEREALATELRACCHDGAGFFYLVGHGVEPRLFDEVLSTARRAFELPDDVKLRLDKRRSPHFRGFEPTGAELTGGRPDTREQFDTWSDCEPVPNAAGNDRLLGPSQYFDDATLPGYERITKEWMTRLSAVSVELLEVLSLALELPPSALHDRFGPEPERQSLIKYIHYPPTPTDGQGVGLHQDSQFLTILLPGEEPGLEVQLPSGQMVAVPPRENAFVVNLGDVMTLLTGNYFVATPHRVVARNDRFAIGFFYGPSLDTELAPLPLAPKFAAAVEASERHRTVGVMPRKDELEEGVAGTFSGASRYETYGDLLWQYFTRAYPENVARWYPDG